MNTASKILNDQSDKREQVMAICGMPEEELNEMQFNAAMDCLEKVLETDEHGITELPKNVSFWLWWKEQWYRRDMKFLDALELDVVLMKYTCPMPCGKTRIVLNNGNDTIQMYRLYHRMNEDNPLVNNEGMEVSFHYLIKELANKRATT